MKYSNKNLVVGSEVRTFNFIVIDGLLWKYQIELISKAAWSLYDSLIAMIE